MSDLQIDTYQYVLSSIGNAYFSNLTFAELWGCIELSENREELDTAIETLIDLKQMIKTP